MTNRLFEVKTGVCSLKELDESYTLLEFEYTKKTEMLKSSPEICLDLKDYNLELVQAAKEKLTLSINVKLKYTEKSQWENCFDSSCKINLVFANEFHKMNFWSEYEYEVFCEICFGSTLVSEDNVLPTTDHLQLLTVKQKRFSNGITCSAQKSFSKELYLNKLKHVCIGIKRYKINCTTEQLSKNNLNILKEMQTGLYSDLSLICNNETIPAHRRILALHSPVFNAMFSHNMLEKQQGIVRIDDFDADVIREVLNFIYIGKVKSMDIVALELYKVAQKYEVLQLVELCTEHFIFNLNPDNIVDILEVATMFNQTTLVSAIKKFIIEDDAIMKRKDYQDYVCRNFSEENIVHNLILCIWYPFLQDVKLKAFEFVKTHKEILRNPDFLNTIYPHEELMKEMIRFLAE